MEVCELLQLLIKVRPIYREGRLVESAGNSASPLCLLLLDSSPVGFSLICPISFVLWTNG